MQSRGPLTRDGGRGVGWWRRGRVVGRRGRRGAGAVAGALVPGVALQHAQEFQRSTMVLYSRSMLDMMLGWHARVVKWQQRQRAVAGAPV